MKRRHPDSKLTLRESFERHYDKTDLAPRTVKKHRHTLNLWEKCTDNPPVGQITNETVATFKTKALQTLAGNSVNAHWTSIRAILRRLGPPEYKNPDGLSIIPGPVPHMKRCKVELKPPRRIDLEDLTRFYVACKHAQFPRVGVPPADWWRALITLAYFSGLRKSDLLALTFGQIDLDRGELTFTAGKTAKSDRFVLHPVAAEHLKRIWRPVPEERIFRGMYSIGSRLYKVWDEIDEHAKITEPFRLHDIRKTAASEVERVRPGMAKVLLQHCSDRSVTGRYLNQMQELGEAILAMRVPPGWKPGPKMADRAEEKQRQERAEIRAAEFQIPYGANPAEWQFSKFGFRFRGSRWFKMEGRKLALLRAFVQAGEEPLGVEALQKILGTGKRGAMDVHPRIADLRARLRRFLGLADSWDPLPCIARGNGGVWTLHIPPNVKPPETAAPAPDAAQLGVFGWLTPAMVRAARMRLGLPQRNLAGQVGVSQSTLCMWENGLLPFYADHVRKLIDVLGIKEPKMRKDGAA